MEQAFSPEGQTFKVTDLTGTGDMNGDMDESSSESRPLSKLLDDDTIRVMEYFIPYCEIPVGRVLAMMIKVREIRKILNEFSEPQLKACGLDAENGDIESLLRSLKKTVSPELAGQIDSILQVFQFSRMYRRFSEITKDHPEILNMMSGDRSGGDFGSSGGPAAFSDPSVFMLLNSMMNNNGNNNNSGNGEAMKNVLELAMKGML